MTTREERAKERALKRKQKRLITFFAVFLAIIIVVMAALGIILNRVTPNALSTTEGTTADISGSAQDCYNNLLASSMVLHDYVFEITDLENTVRRELGDGFNTTLHVFLSISDGEHEAKVVCGSGATLQEAWSAAEQAAGELVRDELLPTVYLKADIVNRIERVASSQLGARIAADAGIYGEFFRKGISFDAAFSASLLEAEINANELIDYDVSKDLIMEKINLYLAQKDAPTVQSLPESVYLFTCRGYVKDVDGCYTLGEQPDTDYGRRTVQVVDRDYVSQMMTATASRMFEQMSANGQFANGYYPISGLPIEQYDLAGQAAALSSLSRYAEAFDSAGLYREDLQKAASALSSRIVSRDENTAFALNEETGEITAGACIQSVLAFLDYDEAKDDANSAETAKRLGNGLLTMIDPSTGKLNHVLNADYSVKTAQTDRTFDSAAVYALSRLYGETEDERYLNAAKTMTNALIRENYTQYGDCWISVAMEELTKYDKSTEYFNFAIRNFNDNADALESRVISMPQYTILLVSTYRIYTQMQAENITTDLFSSFDYNRLVTLTVSRAEDLLNGVAYPEVAMYFHNPADTIGLFYVRQDGFRVRLDDNAAFLRAWLEYSDVYTAVSAEAFGIAAQNASTAPAAAQ